MVIISCSLLVCSACFFSISCVAAIEFSILPMRSSFSWFLLNSGLYRLRMFLHFSLSACHLSTIERLCSLSVKVRNRYRIRMDLGEGNDIFTETYGPKDGENFVLVGNAQWEPSNYNYTPEGFVDNGIAFDATLSLKAEGYTHTLVKSEDQSTLVPSVEAMARIYPTFVRDQIMVEAQGDCVVSIASVTGQMLQRTVCPLGTTTLDATGLPQGMLIVCVEQNGKIISTQRVIKL